MLLPCWLTFQKISCAYLVVDSGEEGCEAVSLSDVLGRSVASPELIVYGPVCEDCDFLQVCQDAGPCGSDVSVVSFVSCPRLASCDVEMCPEEVCLLERELRVNLSSSMVCVVRFTAISSPSQALTVS